jgi:hypothetical protein
MVIMWVGWLMDRESCVNWQKVSVIEMPSDMRINPPAHMPLAPLMPELVFGTIDVLLEQPDLLPSVDFGDLRDDMD